MKLKKLLFCLFALLMITTVDGWAAQKKNKEDWKECSNNTKFMMVCNKNSTCKIMLSKDGKAETDKLTIPEKLTCKDDSKEYTVVEISNFKGCKAKEIVLPSTVTTIGANTFTERTKKNKNACNTCLQKINLDHVTTIGKQAFLMCTAFEGTNGDLIIPNSVTKIGKNAFYGCTKLTGTLTLPDNLESLESGLFYNTNLHGNIVLPKNLKHIGNGAFLATKLGVGQDLVVPASVTKIEPYAFSRPETAQWASITFAAESELEKFGDGCLMAKSYTDNTKVYAMGVVFGSVEKYIDLSACKKIDVNSEDFGYWFQRYPESIEGKKHKVNNEEMSSVKRGVFANVDPWVLIYLPSQFKSKLDSALNAKDVFDKKKYIAIIKGETKTITADYPVNFVVVDSTDKENNPGICKDLRLYEGKNFYARYPFKAEKASYRDARYADFIDLANEAAEQDTCCRKYTHCKTCYTLYLPYAAHIEQNGSGAKAYQLFDHVNNSNGGGSPKYSYYRFKSINEGEAIPAYTPVVLCDKNGKSNISFNIKFEENVEVAKTPKPEEKELKEGVTQNGDICFYGTTLWIKHDSITTNYPNSYILGKNNTWYLASKAKTQQKPLAIPPFRGFIHIKDGSAAAAKMLQFAMLLDDDDENGSTNKIETTEIDNFNTGKLMFYSIDGKPMGTRYDLLPNRQVYIVNGKKIYKI